MAKKGRRTAWMPILKWAALIAIIGIGFGIATISVVFWTYGRDPKLPNIEKLSDYHPKQVTTILDANGHRIGELFSERRSVISLEKIPPIVIDAFVAAEDNKFWTHSGIDYLGMVRALLVNVRSGSAAQGASTITQQVVKNLLLSPEKSFRRKVQEIILARRLERALTKKEIMTLYLNEIYFGRGRYGIVEAARYYFGKDVPELTIGEATVLASLPKEPEKLGNALVSLRTGASANPTVGYAKDRQKYVINNLVEMGKLPANEAEQWKAAKIQVVDNPFPELGVAPEWIDVVRKQLVALEGVTVLERKGHVIRTTLDPQLQNTAQRALQAGLRAVDKRQHVGRPARTVKPDRVASELAVLAKRLGGEPPKPKRVYEAVVTEVRDLDKLLNVDLGKYPAAIQLGTEDDARLNPPDDNGKTKKPSERFKVGDVVEVVIATDGPTTTSGDEVLSRPGGAGSAQAVPRRVEFAPGPEGAVVIIDAKTRSVRALVGGYASRAAGFNRATMAKRQPGSSFKPIVYAAAFERAAAELCHANDPSLPQVCATPASIVNDAPEVFDLWRPKNFETGEYIGPVRLRSALAKSINTVSIRLTFDLTPAVVAAMANKLGVKSALPTEMSLALGSGEVTPIELVNAYATIAAGGEYADPKFIDTIDRVLQAPARREQVIPPEVAYVLADTMRSVVMEGTAASVGARLKVPIAGKTGTSNEARDTWFIGFTPDVVIGVWIGYDDNRPMPGEQGSRVAVPVFADIAKTMKLPDKPFSRPDNVVEAVIDRQTGLLAPEGAPENTTLREVFVSGTEPTEVAPKPGDVTEGSSVTGSYGE
jgi:penicillin-binding protein 1A